MCEFRVSRSAAWGVGFTIPGFTGLVFEGLGMARTEQHYGC